MKPMELVELIKVQNPKLLGNVSDKKAALIIRTALMKIGEQVAAAEEGVVKFPGLGNFRIRNIEREKDGVKVTERRVQFIKPIGGSGKKNEAVEA